MIITFFCLPLAPFGGGGVVVSALDSDLKVGGSNGLRKREMWHAVQLFMYM